VLKSTIPTSEGIPFIVKCSAWPQPLLRADREGLVSHAGSRPLAERAGGGPLEGGAAADRRPRRHDPAKVLVDLAIT
jgi:hypothetical protein